MNLQDKNYGEESHWGHTSRKVVEMMNDSLKLNRAGNKIEETCILRAKGGIKKT